MSDKSLDVDCRQLDNFDVSRGYYRLQCLVPEACMKFDCRVLIINI